ncbi:AAA family ATPase [Clostridium sp.]|uniref:AAA family ATPase n=1 Tax=Clostridium sp. TaxID=1506 RepID=UPI002FC9747C
MSIELPKSKIPAETQDPKRLIIFSKPKIGKSTALANLPNCLCIDLESGGYDYIDALKVKISTVKELKELCKAIMDAGNPYKFIALDTITILEEMVKPLALKLYLNTTAGNKFTGDDIIDAPMGAGYQYIRKGMEMCIDMVAKCTPNIILVCHSKDAAIAATELNTKQIDLLGKSGRILASKSDGIGFMTRDENFNTILSFNTNDTSIEAGARPGHLRNKEIVLGEMQEDGNVIYHWERIFPSLKK